MSNTKQPAVNRIEFISVTGRPLANITKLDLICNALRDLLQEDQKRWEPDQDFLGGPDTVIEEFLAGMEEYWGQDPTPNFLYDNSGGEPPITADEMWQTDFRKKQELHS